MKKYFIVALCALMFASCSSNKVQNEIDKIKDDAVDSAQDGVNDQVDDILDPLPELNGRFLGSAVTTDKNFDIELNISDKQLSVQLNDGTTSFTATGSILVSINSSGKKNLEIINSTLTWKIESSDYPKFTNSETYSGIIKLNDKNLSLEFNFTPGSSPSGFGEGDWRCEAVKE